MRILLALLALAGNAIAATHYVSPSGSASWANSTNIAQPASLATANANVAAGDLVYLRGGTYGGTTGIAPAAGGTSGNRITYEAYTGETPLIRLTDETIWPIDLTGTPYVTVRGVEVDGDNVTPFFVIRFGSTHCELDSCTFYDASDFQYSAGLITDFNSAFTSTVATNNIWIHDCSFRRYGTVTDAGSDDGTIRINGGVVGMNTCSANQVTIEDCVFSHGAHDCLEVGSSQNVVRNNTFWNDESVFADNTGGSTVNTPASGYFGNRNILLAGNGPDTEAHHTINNLIEGNRCGHAGTPPDDDGAMGIEDAGTRTIARYNFLFNNGATGYYSKRQPAGAYAWTPPQGSYCRVYNNTIYRNGYGDASIGTGFKHGMDWIGGFDDMSDPVATWPTDVKAINNIVFGNLDEYAVTSHISAQLTYTNNLNTDPSFQGTDVSTPENSATDPKLSLSKGSAAIDNGVALTNADGAGASSTSLAVDDANFFQDGTWGSSLSTVEGDWVAVGSPSSRAQVTAVNYGTNTLTISPALTWSDNDPIYLYSKSDSEVVFYGGAPDQGAHEWRGGTRTPTAARRAMLAN